MGVVGEICSTIQCQQQVTFTFARKFGRKLCRRDLGLLGLLVYDLVCIRHKYKSPKLSSATIIVILGCTEFRISEELLSTLLHLRCVKFVCPIQVSSIFNTRRPSLRISSIYHPNCCLMYKFLREFAWVGTFLIFPNRSP